MTYLPRCLEIPSSSLAHERKPSVSLSSRELEGEGVRRRDKEFFHPALCVGNNTRLFPESSWDSRKARMDQPAAAATVQVDSCQSILNACLPLPFAQCRVLQNEQNDPTWEASIQEGPCTARGLAPDHVEWIETQKALASTLFRGGRQRCGLWLSPALPCAASASTVYTDFLVDPESVSLVDARNAPTC
ncbi:hypothetical protein BU24DRAFT_406942 [Aaosphaeria arxii CBS 175.79]|uniref:Uncharacterized protein n=1 Tax=Aaosphaeria arxii CBS 175.79 TaxID=1450172 RepID=A0A6A5XUG2_9PLEO|nr:uncharacterized protein BU24DRAFT_406942 [Aaosphaeria arxii CBS 175.79]KAF2016842.1 hypothetical protein BU24DRAFT_406942 [Aaosphaeria arxii CBS 175.79]